jgi:hypothetical protein
LPLRDISSKPSSVFYPVLVDTATINAGVFLWVKVMNEESTITIDEETYYIETYAQGEIESALCEQREKNNVD